MEKNSKLWNHATKKKLDLKDLELGTYILVYESLFKKEEHLRIEITESKRYEAKLCTDFIDYSKETYKPIIERLQENEFYTILLSSQGCFHTTQETVTIKRYRDVYEITWGTKTKELSVTDIETLKCFELELNYMVDGGCTTTDTYIIQYAGTTIQIHDGSCNWNGGYYLKKQLFDGK